MADSRSHLTPTVLAWAALGILISFAAEVLFEWFWIKAALAVVLWLAIGTALIVTRLWKARQATNRRDAFAAAGAVVFVGIVVLIASPFAAQLGASATERVRFSLHHSDYDRIAVEAERSQPEAGRHESDGVVYLIDRGPPLRIAFPWPSGTVFGWCGAVHDPSREVARIDETPAPMNLRGLFGGEMTDCHEVAESYYVCCFTQVPEQAEDANEGDLQ